MMRSGGVLKARTINKHNNNPIFSPNVDIELSTNPDQVMQLPIPLSEINANDLIN